VLARVIERRPGAVFLFAVVAVITSGAAILGTTAATYEARHKNRHTENRVPEHRHCRRRAGQIHRQHAPAVKAAWTPGCGSGGYLANWLRLTGRDPG
jgi:hypothetical protein